MFAGFTLLEEVLDYATLGTGYSRQKVVVVDQNMRLLFISRVSQNHPSKGKLIFENRKVFQLHSRTLEKQNVSLYRWSQECQICIRWQLKKDQIERWLENARAEDVFVLAGFVAKESGLPETKHHPALVNLARLEIQDRLRYLSPVQLQGLTGMLFPVPERIAA